MDYAENVARGIALLDEKGPPGWRERINLATLDLDHLELCILGQVYGREDSGYSGYYQGCKALRISHLSGVEGDAVSRLGFMPAYRASSYALTAAWKTALGHAQ